MLLLLGDSPTFNGSPGVPIGKDLIASSAQKLIPQVFVFEDDTTSVRDVHRPAVATAFTGGNMAVSDVNDLVSVSISIQQSLQSFTTQQQQLAPTAPKPQSSTIASDAVEVSLSIEATLQRSAQQNSTKPSTDGSQTTPVPSPDGQGYHGLRRLERQKANFDSIDTSGDGTLSLDELKAAQSSRQAEGHKTPFLDRLINSFDQSDSDKSGGISFAEAHPKEAAYVQQLFGFANAQTQTPAADQSASQTVAVQA